MVSLSQSCILVSVWLNIEVTCVFVVWPHMHSKLELPLVIAGIQVREDKQQLLPLICRSHHCEPAVNGMSLLNSSTARCQ